MDDPYIYPGTDVLRNMEDIRNEDELAEFERLATASRMETLPHNLPISADGYRDIHRHIFQDVYDWAGQDRTVDISKSTSYFCKAGYIDRELEKRFEAINGGNNLQGLTTDQFSSRAAEHINELNAIHPFREGNGRVQRAFLSVLAEQAGHEVDLVHINPQDWNKASIDSFFTGDNRPMRDIIASSIVEREAERQAVADQEQSGSRGAALDTPTTAEKDAKDFEASATSGELSDDKQAKISRLSSELKPDSGSTPDQDHGKGRPQGGGRSRGH
jgi:cell filamentation protein